jgi:hypothetical protein
MEKLQIGAKPAQARPIQFEAFEPLRLSPPQQRRVAGQDETKKNRGFATAPFVFAATLLAAGQLLRPNASLMPYSTLQSPFGNGDIQRY